MSNSETTYCSHNQLNAILLGHLYGTIVQYLSA